MSRRVKRQHKCKSLIEYRSILGAFNWRSALRFRGIGITDEDEALAWLRKHNDRVLGKKMA